MTALGQGRALARVMRDQAVQAAPAREQALVTALGQGRALAQGRVTVGQARAAAPAAILGLATAALVVVLDPATEEEGQEPAALDPVGRGGPGQAPALDPPAIPQLSG